MIEKRATQVGSDLEFVLSDDSVDRTGDIIEASGWDLRQFRKNPVALFGHEQGLPPIGRWENLRIEGNKLLGRLVLASKGTSQRIDEISELIRQGILTAVSVGFKPLERVPNETGGYRYKKQELLECSVVPVPCNSNALRVAKSLNLSDETINLVFGESAEGGRDTVRRVTGKSADVPTSRKKDGPMSATISKKIEDTQTRVVTLQDELQKHLEGIGDEANEGDNDITKGLNDRIKAEQERLDALRNAEKRLANAVSIEKSDDVTKGEPRKPFAVAAKKVEPMDYVFRGLTVLTKAHVEKRPFNEVMQECYGEDVVTRAVANSITKAAVAPADTATPAWAGALVQTAIGDFFDLLLPQSVYPNLSNKGGRYGFGRNGTISLPTRDATPTVAGSFVGEGAPIPVRRAGFSSITLTPKKMAVITTMTREITERSTPAIEQLLRNAIQEDTAVAIDSVLLDNGAATTVRPAGLRNGVTTAAGTAGGGIAAVVADLKGMLGTLITNTAGNVRNPVWLMNPAQALALTLTQNAGGEFPFAAEVNGGRFRGYDIIQSTTVPAGVVMLIDAADFFSATGDDPRFDISDQATLHMEDTTPLQIGSAGTPTTVAAPVRSMFQTDSLALRMILPMNWSMRRAGVVVERTAVTW